MERGKDSIFKTKRKSSLQSLYLHPYQILIKKQNPTIIASLHQSKIPFPFNHQDSKFPSSPIIFSTTKQPQNHLKRQDSLYITRRRSALGLVMITTTSLSLPHNKRKTLMIQSFWWWLMVFTVKRVCEFAVIRTFMCCQVNLRSSKHIGREREGVLKSVEMVFV